MLFNTSVSTAAAKHVEEENRELMQHATPEMNKLYEGLGSARWLALCVDDGAYTGGRRGGASGKIEQAHGGVLLLDEIGDMPLPLQARCCAFPRSAR